MSQEPITNIDAYFGGLEGLRTGNNVQRPLINIIPIAIYGVIGGADSGADMEAYGQATSVL